ncbi:Predicted nucleic acid-binding protein, contains PIN domain [Streptosporangium canum]|uniref:Predicted nucleic acid-binding protein, contains PIN domain n=1 Tax=Streptosporangium canum TaxID=324952 RepID=A0A1I4A3T2_9ACTN|nr:hypothetical protein [Streptosporangium canum]SFK50998.1 Predicted nucleic acid-binding protein, contains PIN domain [Streptosporangium canum]
MEDASETFVFDTGPLSAFATNNWLGVLKAVVGKRRALVPDVVVAELMEGEAKDSRIGVALTADWIEHHELRSQAEMEAFADFSELLVVGDKNVGEAGVLALARTMRATAVLDDSAARKAAASFNVDYCPTLRLLCWSIRDGLLTVPLVAELADDLLSSKYHLPFRRGGFKLWAEENGLLDSS